MVNVGRCHHDKVRLDYTSFQVKKKSLNRYTRIFVRFPESVLGINSPKKHISACAEKLQTEHKATLQNTLCLVTLHK